MVSLFSPLYESGTHALQVLAGILPLHLRAKELFANFLVKTQKIQVKFNDSIIDPDLYEPTLNPYEQHPSEWATYPFGKTPPSGDDIEIYTDGSKIDNKVGSAIACYYFNKLVHIDSHRLEDHATVFQAEAYALYMALDFIVNTNSWRNEEADKQAKLATRKDTVDSRVPRSHNTLKSDIRRNIIEEWQNEWASTTKGPQTHQYLPKVSTKIKTFHPSIIQFLSGHGMFPSYFKKFGITDNPLCDCGDVGTADHYVFECVLTQSLRQKLNLIPSKDHLIQDPKNLHVIQQIITWDPIEARKQKDAASARSCEYGGCSRTVTRRLAKKLRARIAITSNYSLDLFNIYWNIMSRSRIYCVRSQFRRAQDPTATNYQITVPTNLHIKVWTTWQISTV
ncbi:Retrovirus-related Pol polyprotein type-1 like protein [Argiope bruennichi]|uniref:Retrovirus-related Pol polyprotein type-1 like protein n=1 Tax=Argiope bruennichi TaxID=94029 RepID=A0A8T0E9E1_ARGBR|nr:Retrovirus-related Pol polyprotein type-1 like protein [Argiope bruennichi]